MAKYKIEINADECIGCGACAAACPEGFEMKDDNKAYPKDSGVDNLGERMSAAEVCPVNCIHITDTETNEKKI